MNSRLRFFLLAIVLSSTPLFARDVWVLQGTAVSGSGCDLVTWLGSIEFFNAGQAPATVRFVDVSGDQDLAFRPSSVTINPGEMIQTFAWNFSSPTERLSVVHLDVPDEVTTRARLSIGGQRECPPFPPIDRSAIHGKAVLPIRTALIPAGRVQPHLDTDLGTLTARSNVAVFNASENDAHAHIEVRRACDLSVIDSRDLTIAPRAVVQTNNLSATSNCTGDQGTTDNAPYVTYAIVTVDQPSVSWVTTLSNSLTPDITYGVE